MAGLVADVFDAILMTENGDVLATDTLQESGIESTVETNDVTGGKGDELIAVLHGRREIEITLTDPVWRFDMLALHIGQDIKTGEDTAYAMPKFYEVKEGSDPSELTIELDHSPVNADSVKIYADDGTRVPVDSVSGNTVTISDIMGGLEAGENVEVRTYEYKTSNTTEALEINNSVFPKNVKLVLETLEIDESEQPTHRIQYQFDNVRPSADFSVSTSSAREQSNSEAVFRVLKHRQGNQTVGKVLRIPIEDSDK